MNTRGSALRVREMPRGGKRESRKGWEEMSGDRLLRRRVDSRTGGAERVRSGSVSKRGAAPPPAPPGHARQGRPRGRGGKRGRELKEKERKGMESSLLAWLSHGKKPGSTESRGGLGLGEKVEPGPRGGSQGSARDRPHTQSASDRSTEEVFTDDAGVKRPQRNQGGSAESHHQESKDS